MKIKNGAAIALSLFACTLTSTASARAKRGEVTLLAKPAKIDVQLACLKRKNGKAIVGLVEKGRFVRLGSSSKARRLSATKAGRAAVAEATRSCKQLTDAGASPKSVDARPTPSAGEPKNSSGIPASPPSLPPVPELSEWEQRMKEFGAKHCQALQSGGDFDTQLLSTYYDAEWVYYQIGDYTKDASWHDCAQAAEAVYRDRYVLASGGKVPGYWNFTHGLTEDFLRTGDTQSRDAVVALATQAAFAVDGTDLASTESADYSREVAYAMMAYMNAETVGQPRRSRLHDLEQQAIGHLNQWFVSKNTSYIRPFMVALTAHALISYKETVGDDPQILPLLQTAADWLWDNMWLPSSGAFQYTNVDTAAFSPAQFAYNTGGTEPAADLNLLVAPLYAWIYHQTGDDTYRDRADQIFAGGVRGANLTNGKQFDQSYRWSFAYLKWRNAAPLQ